MVSAFIQRDVNLAENFRVKGNGNPGVVQKISGFMEFENFEPDQMSVVLCQNINNDTFKDARELIDRGIVPKKLSVTSQK